MVPEQRHRGCRHRNPQPNQHRPGNGPNPPRALVIARRTGERMLLSNTLKARGFIVNAVKSPQQAALLMRPDRLDLVVMELPLRVLRAAIVQKLRVRYGPSLPLLALAAHPAGELCAKLELFAVGPTVSDVGELIGAAMGERTVPTLTQWLSRGRSSSRTDSRTTRLSRVAGKAR